MAKGLLLIAAVVCLAAPVRVRAQSVHVGERVRVSLTDHVLPSRFARTGKLRTVVGTLRAIEPDTIRLQTSAADSAEALPRILIYRVERSLGRGRVESTGDAALAGFGLGAVTMGFFPKKAQLTVAGIGAALGAIVGVVHPYERWEEAWIPECCSTTGANDSKPAFRVIAFFTAREDQAHISFVHEANRWFPEMAARYNFSYDTTSNWNNLNSEFLSGYQVVVFLDTRPEDAAQRAAFQAYMEHGGAWMGFHFAGFALTPSAYPANWDWYHNTFLGAGSYVSNTWRPTSAILRVEDRKHPATSHLPETFSSSPSEWYRWEKDLRQNPDIDLLLSIDSTSFPLGTGPKLHEIWHSGYYPVVWTNRNYKMIYLNMGHNDIDYEHKYDATNRTLSYTLNNPVQDRLIVDALLWLGDSDKKAPGHAR